MIMLKKVLHKSKIWVEWRRNERRAMNDTLTPTPRTDGEECYSKVTSDFARTLERELTAAREELAVALKAFDAQVEAWYEVSKQRDRLAKEVEILRLYGNKDCTAMADEALQSLNQPEP